MNLQESRALPMTRLMLPILPGPQHGLCCKVLKVNLAGYRSSISFADIHILASFSGFLKDISQRHEKRSPSALVNLRSLFFHVFFCPIDNCNAAIVHIRTCNLVVEGLPRHDPDSLSWQSERPRRGSDIPRSRGTNN